MTTITRHPETVESPVARLLGYDRDEQRSTHYSLGDVDFVHNIFVGISTPVPDECRKIYEAPAPIRELVAALIGSELAEGTTLGGAADLAESLFRITSVSNQLDGRSAADYGPALAAQDVDASVLDVNHVLLASGPYAYRTIQVSYDNQGVKAAANQPEGDKSDADSLASELQARHAPQSIVNAARAFVLKGFTCTKRDGTTLIFRKGEGYSFVRAQVSYIVS